MDTPNNIIKKLHAIMTSVQSIPKDAKNVHQGYEYASERIIKERLHEALVTNGVLFRLETKNPRVDNGVTWIDCRYTFTDVDSGESVSGDFLGSGQARDEKGHYAAITGAIKYILTSTFLIPTGDDPENDVPSPARPAAKPATKYPLKAWSANKDQLKQIADLTKKLGAETPDQIIPALNKWKPELKLTSGKDISRVMATTLITMLEAYQPDTTPSGNLVKEDVDVEDVE